MTKSVSKILLAFFLVSFGNLGCFNKSTPENPSYIDARTFCEKHPTAQMCEDLADREEMTPQEAKITATIYEQNQSVARPFSYTDMKTYNAINKVYAISDNPNDVTFRMAVTENPDLVGIEFEPKYYMVSNGTDHSPNAGNSGIFYDKEDTIPMATTMYMSYPEARGQRMIVVLLFEDKEHKKRYLDLPNFIVETIETPESTR